MLQVPKIRCILPSHSVLLKNTYSLSETAVGAYHLLFLIIKTAA